MTRQGKCETCRKRKIKCDERRPTCSACAKKSRPCHYSPEKAIINDSIGEQLIAIDIGGKLSSAVSVAPATVVRAEENEEKRANNEILPLKYIRRTGDNVGLYLTFKRTLSHRRSLKHKDTFVLQSESPAAALQCPETKLVRQWGAIFGYDALDLNPLGAWLRLVWPAINHDPAIHNACEFALSSLEFFQVRSEPALNRAYHAGTKAIESLQRAVNTCSGPEQTRNLVLAISLHSAAEHFIKIGTFNYVSHILASTELLKMYGAMNASNEFIKTMAKSMSMDEMLEAVLYGKQCSVFEKVFELPADVSSMSASDVYGAMELVQYMLAQLPRLVYDTRDATSGEDDGQSRSSDVVGRISTLFNHEAKFCVERCIKAHSKITAENDDGTPSPLRSHLEFDTTQAFYMAIAYNFAQTVICGLMQALGKDHADGTTLLDVPAARSQDVAAATSLAMCVEYALKPTPSRSFTALAVLAPLQLSIGSWIRMQRRQPSKVTSEYVQATEMAEWVSAKQHYIVEMWQSAPASIERMTVLSDMFAGGPYVPNRGRKQEASEGQA